MKKHSRAKTRGWMVAELKSLGEEWRKPVTTSFGSVQFVPLTDSQLQRKLERLGYSFGADDGNEESFKPKR